MRRFLKSASIVGVLGLGYLLGASHSAIHSQAIGQGVGEDPDADEVAKEIATAYTALQSVKNLLNQEGRYNSASKTLNMSAVMSGGVDAIADLESGRGVDPETFAALYADQASDEVRIELDFDEFGRLTYKGKVVRMYSIARLKKMYQERLRYTKEDEAAPGF